MLQRQHNQIEIHDTNYTLQVAQMILMMCNRSEIAVGGAYLVE